MMSTFKRLFGRTKESKKPLKADSPTNRVIKKVMFYGFLVFTTITIVSKKYKTKLIFTFEQNEENMKIIDTLPVFH